MAETISSAIVTEKNKIHNTSPWVWLVEADVDGTNAIRIAGYDAQVVYGGNIYYPYPIQIGAQDKNKEGTLHDLELTVANYEQVVAVYLEAGHLLGRKCTIRLLTEADLTTQVHESSYFIKTVTTTLGSAQFVLGAYSLMAAQIPAVRFNRTRCRWVYGGPGCEYDTTMANEISGTNPDFDITACDLELGSETSGNGCRAHGANEAANGQPKKHPLRFGGFPGIPKGPARV